MKRRKWRVVCADGGYETFERESEARLYAAEYDGEPESTCGPHRVERES